METSFYKTFKNPKEYLLLALEDHYFSENPYKSINLWKRFSHALFVFLLSYFAFIYFSYTPPPHLPPPKPYLESYLNQITNISVELQQITIQANSLHNQVVPLLISRKIQDLKPPSEASVDLLLVFDFSAENYWSHKEWTKHVRELLKSVLPWMSSQDRLSVVLLENIRPDGDILSILPFTNITKDSQEIFSEFGANFLRGNESRINGDGKAALNLLNLRNGTNQTTGVFFFTNVHDRSSWSVDFSKRYFRPEEDQNVIIRAFSTIKIGRTLKQNLKELKAGVFKSHFSIKSEESDILKGVKILSKSEKETNLMEWLEWREWLLGENKPFLIPSQDFQIGLEEEFLFYLRIPRIPKLKNTTEAKVASCQEIYFLKDGSKVVKNVDLILKIIGEEEEEFVEEEKSWKAMKEFEKKWEKDWLATPIFVLNEDANYRHFREVLKRIKRI